MPIPTSKYHCTKGQGGCCSREFIPLEVAYARTIHKFQGLTAGPVDEGKIPNMYQCIICDPDMKKFEGSALGLLYTATSRATTLGNIRNGLGSAIYFSGVDFKESRIRRLTICKDSDKLYERATKRKRWVQHLEKNERRCTREITKTLKKEKEIIQFFTKRITYDQLFTRVNRYKIDNINRHKFQ